MTVKKRVPIHKKVKAGAAAGGLSTAIVILLGQVGVEVPADVAVAAVTVVQFVAGYFKKG